MIRLVAGAVVAIIANAVALVVANLLLDDMTVDAVGLITATIIFTVVMVLAQPLLRQVAVKQAPALLGSTALVATLVSLVVTALIGDSLTIDGTTTWVLATVIVWIVALAARLLLPLVIFKQALANHRDGA